MALPDAGAREDPFVGGIDQALQVGIAQYFLRQIAAGACNTRLGHAGVSSVRFD